MYTNPSNSIQFSVKKRYFKGFGAPKYATSNRTADKRMAAVQILL